LVETTQMGGTVGQDTVGGILSLVKVTVCVAVPVLPHASVTVQFLVTDTWQPFTTSGAMVPVAVKPVEQLSVTVAAPKAAATSAGVALQFTGPATPRAIEGGVLSLVKVIVCVAVPVLPHASVTVQSFVTDTWHPVTTSAAMVPVAVRPVEQLSVTVAAPNAAATCAAVALQPKVPAADNEITGF
jgi:succinate dehydrogenase/fumarate reductase cytochrome b subunit